MPIPPRIAIIGGSLVGPAAELFLRQAGFTDVTTYEASKVPHPQSGGVMGLRLPTLGLLAGIGIPTNRIVALNDARTFAYDLTEFNTLAPRGPGSVLPGMVTSWDALHHQLAARVAIQYGQRLTELIPESDGPRYLLKFANGTTDTADVVLFADGRKSVGRQLLDPARNYSMDYAGYVVWRGLSDVGLLDSVGGPVGNVTGFWRIFDIPGGRLFSVTGPVATAEGRNYWEFSHNLPVDKYKQLTGSHPTERAYLFPQMISDELHGTILGNAVGFPDWLIDLITDGEISGIPVNDLAVPTQALWRHGDGQSVAALLGDALMPVRLQVGAGLNHGLHQAAEFALALASNTPNLALTRWDHDVIAKLGPVVELGRSRAHRTNLGTYQPVRPGYTAVPLGDQWSDPQWVTA